MKKILILVICLLLCGCKSENIIEEKIPSNNEVKNEEIINQYKDLNETIISIYDDSTGKLLKVDNTIYLPWEKKKDITVLSFVYSNEADLGSGYFQDIWHNYANQITDLHNYTNMWNVTFELKDGTIINQNIDSPEDVEYFYDYLEIYLYNSAKVPKNTWYSHVTKEQMNNEIILTTIKLTAGSKYDEITSSIKLTAFTYDTLDDFENDVYIGNSKYLVEIFKK